MYNRNVNIERLVAVCIGLFVAMIIGELMLRFSGIGFGNSPFISDPVLHHKNPENYTFLWYAPHMKNRSHMVRYDKEGSRIPLDFLDEEDNSLSIDSKQCRIALVGDSFVDALEVPYHQTFGARLGDFFKDECTVKSYGVGSYSPLLTLLQWRVKVKDFHPTHVFHLLYDNDIADDNYYRSLAMYENGEIIAVPGVEDSPITKLLRKSYLARFLRYLQINYEYLFQGLLTKLKGEEKKYTYSYSNKEQEEFTKENIKKLNNEIIDSGINYVLLTVPSNYKFHEMPEAWAKELKIKYLNLHHEFKKRHEEGPFIIKEDFHFNEAGHKVTFEVIRDHLLSEFQTRDDDDFAN